MIFKKAQIGKCTLYLGDCLDVFPELPENSIESVITDPPFAFTGGISNGASSQVSDQFFAHWWRDVCTEMVKVLKPEGSGFCWCDWKTAPSFSAGFQPKIQTYDYWRVSQMIYHHREMPGMGKPFRSSVDMIAYLRGPKHRNPPIPATTLNFISKYWYYGKHDNHPAEKDPEIAKQLIKWSGAKTIIDPFMGSGTVGVAAVLLDKIFIGIELEELHFETACRRIEEVQGIERVSSILEGAINKQSALF